MKQSWRTNKSNIYTNINREREHAPLNMEGKNSHIGNKQPKPKEWKLETETET
jgi:hypothetical protein